MPYSLYEGFLIIGCLIFKLKDLQERKPVMVDFVHLKMSSFDNYIVFKWDMSFSLHQLLVLGNILNFLYPDQTNRSSLVLVTVYVVCHFVCVFDIKA